MTSQVKLTNTDLNIFGPSTGIKTTYGISSIGVTGNNFNISSTAIGSTGGIVTIGSVGTGNVTLGNSTLGVTTISSLTTNIGTSGAATVNIGNTGTTVTADSIVNIGKGANNINIGNTNTNINLSGKIRFSSNPILVYNFTTTSQTQSISSGASTPIFFPNPASYNGTQTGITYNSITGLFTNSNSYSVLVTICLNVGYPIFNNGDRAAWLQHSNSIGTNYRFAVTNAYAGSDYATINACASIVLESTEGFTAYTSQNSGTSLILGGANSNTSPTRISVLVM